jgi:hypothetical protein
LVFIIILNGCAVIKKRNNSFSDLPEPALKGFSLLNLEDNNLLKKSFFIKKAAVKISSGDKIQRFIVSVKYLNPDKYLLSFRSKTGIEAARIFLSSDTVIINDRINRKLYFGKPESLEKKYGIALSVLPLLLGDYLKDKRNISRELSCKEGKLDLFSLIEGYKISYIIDCKNNKSIFTKIESSLNDRNVNLSYKNFISAGDALTPAEIQIRFQQTEINIRIENIESPWAGAIEFIPGKNYELVRLR